jgi:hypothetical protein
VSAADRVAASPIILCANVFEMKKQRFESLNKTYGTEAEPRAPIALCLSDYGSFSGS